MATTITAPLAALTTIFTPPSGCFQTYLITTTTHTLSAYPSFSLLAADDPKTSCDIPNWSSNVGGKGYQYYSPAICPSGFTVGPGCTITQGNGVAKTAQGFPAIDTARGETAAWCVPSGLDCVDNTSDFKGGVWGAATGQSAARSTVVTVAPAVQIRFVQEDLSLLPTHPLTPGLVVAASASAAAVPFASAGATAVAVTASTTASNSLSASTPLVSDGASSTSTSFSVPSSFLSATQDSQKLSQGSQTPSTTQQVASPSNTAGTGATSGDNQFQRTNSTTLTTLILVALLTVLICVALYMFWQHRRLSAAAACETRNGLVDDPERGQQTSVLPTPSISVPTGVVEADSSAEAPTGTSRNPAELDAVETARPRPWSWMSDRISRTLRGLSSNRSSSVSPSAHMEVSEDSADSHSSNHSECQSRQTATSRWTSPSTVAYDGLDLPPTPLSIMFCGASPAADKRAQSTHISLPEFECGRLSRETFGRRSSLGSIDEITAEKEELDHGP